MAKRKASRRRGARAPQNTTAGQLNQEIQDAGFHWRAADPQPTKPALGLRVDEAELDSLRTAIEASNEVEAFAHSFTAPTSIDWRSHNGDWITQVKNQLSCGSCVSFACCGTIEARLNIVCNDPQLDVDLSEADLFFCGCGNCCSTGWNFAPALNHCQNEGVGLESEFPYTPSDQPCRNITAYVQILAWRRLLSADERKSTIAEKGPVVAGMAVYSDFYSYSGGVYRKVPGANLEGYHAVCVVGYDDAQECWIAKNSWGPNWGENGFFRIGYGEVEIDTTFPFYDIDVECPTPVEPEDTCSRYVPFLRQVLAAARTNPRLRACLRYYICRRGWRPYCGAREIQIVRYVVLVLRHCPQYRDPFCRLLG